MLTIYGGEVDNRVIIKNLSRLGNQIYKLLPQREEGKDWEKPLDTIIVEIDGLLKLFFNDSNYLSLLSKLKGMENLNDEKYFLLFRRTVFDCCTLISEVKKNVTCNVAG